MVRTFLFQIKRQTSNCYHRPVFPGHWLYPGKVMADIVTVSHPHPGHSYVQGVADEPRVLKSPGEYESGGVLTVGVHTFHDNERAPSAAKNTVFVIDVDDVMICHLGDLGHVLTAEQVAEINGVDVLLIPVGNVSTIDAVQAAQIVRQLEPKSSSRCTTRPKRKRKTRNRRPFSKRDGRERSYCSTEVTSKQKQHAADDAGRHVKLQIIAFSH